MHRAAIGRAAGGTIHVDAEDQISAVVASGVHPRIHRGVGIGGAGHMHRCAQRLQLLLQRFGILQRQRFFRQRPCRGTDRAAAVSGIQQNAHPFQRLCVAAHRGCVLEMQAHFAAAFPFDRIAIELRFAGQRQPQHILMILALDPRRFAKQRAAAHIRRSGHGIGIVEGDIHIFGGLAGGTHIVARLGRGVRVAIFLRKQLHIIGNLPMRAKGDGGAAILQRGLSAGKSVGGQLAVFLVHGGIVHIYPPAGAKLIIVMLRGGVKHLPHQHIGGAFRQIGVVGTGVILYRAAAEGFGVFRRDGHQCATRQHGTAFGGIENGRVVAVAAGRGRAGVAGGNLLLRRNKQAPAFHGLRNALVLASYFHRAQRLHLAGHPGGQHIYAGKVFVIRQILAAVFHLQRCGLHLHGGGPHRRRHGRAFAGNRADGDSGAAFQLDIAHRRNAFQHLYLIGHGIGDLLPFVAESEGVFAGRKGHILGKIAMIRHLQRLAVEQQRKVGIGAALQREPRFQRGGGFLLG